MRGRFLVCNCVLMGTVPLFAAAPDGLMTEYRENPFGLGTASPRLSWRLPAGTRAQTAYEIEADGRAYGKVVSDTQFGVAYPGALGPRTRTRWRVRTWDENGKMSDWSERATFSVANLAEADWGAARWIGTADAQPPAFVKRFAVKGRAVRATLAVSAAGFYEATLNGVRIGDKLLDPGFFDYDKRMLFSSYPLEGHLREGENELKVLLGHAWYDVRSHAAWDFDTARWRDRPKFILNLDIAYADGTHESVVSDGSWTTAPSPIVYDDIRDGEIIGPSADAPTSPVRLATPPKGALVAASHPATRVRAEHRPVRTWRCDDGRVVADFGVNLVGWMRMRLKGLPKGRVVTFRYDERIQRDGRPSLPEAAYLRADGRRGQGLSRRIDELLLVPGACALLGADYRGFQTDRYTSAGADGETYEPRFTYNGFRYVVISGLDRLPAADDLTAVEIGTDFPKTGSFRCSDETFNRLIEATDRSYRGNFTVAVPTDCPHREKNGWTGDAQIASELAQYFYENTSAYEKWIRDIIDAQNPKGDVPGIVPTSGWGFRWYNGPGWDAALTVIPWNLYCYRGDVRILEEVYPAIQKYLAFTDTKADAGLVRHGLGDWCAVDESHMPTIEYTSSLHYYQAQTIAARVATVLNRPADAARHAEGAAKTRRAILAKYCRGEGTWDNGGQTAQAMALGFGIVPSALVKATEDRLVASVLNAGGQVDFGLFGSKTVFRALSNAGRSDLAFSLAAGHGANQFGSWIDQGATTLWEHMRGTSSLNHIMFGDFAAWACQHLAGIRLAPAKDWADMIPSPTAPAFREMLIAPEPINALSFAEADILTPYGRVFSRWEREGRTVRYRVSLPPGTTARFRAPGVAETEVGPGEHAFTFAEDVDVRRVSSLAPPAAGERFAVCATGVDASAVKTIAADLRVAAKMVAPMNPAEVFAARPDELLSKRPNRVMVICEPSEAVAAALADEAADETDEAVVARRRDALLAYRREIEAVEKSVAASGAKIVYMTPPQAVRPRGLVACAEVVRARAFEAGASCVEVTVPLDIMTRRTKGFAFVADGRLTPLGARLVSAYVLDAIDRARPGCLKAKGDVRFAEDGVSRELDRVYPFSRRFNEGRGLGEGL